MTAALPPLLEFPFPAPPGAGEVVEVMPGLAWLRMPLPFALDHINLWLLDEGDDGCTLVDCGFGDAPTRALWERHFATTIEGRRLARIVVTHYHPDHVGNAAWLAARYGAPVAMTHAEYMTGHAYARQFGGCTLAAGLDLFRRHGMDAAQLAAIEARGNAYLRAVPELPTTFDRLLDGEEIAAGGAAWRVVEGHGHSPEHVSLHSPGWGVLISGDMLLPKISTNVAVHAVEPDADPLGRFLASLAAFDALPADTLVLPSHGLPFRGIALRTAQLRAHHAARLEEIMAAVAAAPAGSVSAAEAVPVLFRRELDVHQSAFAMGEAIAHLNHLWHSRRLVRRVAADGAIRFARAD